MPCCVEPVSAGSKAILVNRARLAASGLACPMTWSPSRNVTGPVPGLTRAVNMSGWSATVLGFDEVSTIGTTYGAAYFTTPVSAAAPPSQNCVNSASSDVMRPEVSALIAKTVNLPLSCCTRGRSS